MKYLGKKIILFLLTLIIVSILTFTAFQVIPGNIAQTALGMEATEESIEDLKEELGLNQPIIKRYLAWLSNALKGDFGISVKYNKPVLLLIKDRLLVSFYLGLLSFTIIVIVSIPLGIISAMKKDRILDKTIHFITQINMAIPQFFLGIIITLIFGFLFKLFKPGVYVSYKESIAGFIYYLIFPAIAVAIPKISILVKFLRNGVIREMELDYVRTGRSKGGSDNYIMYNHVLKNALIPVITLLGMIFADIIAGTVLIEQVFNIPGLGRLLLVSISNRDYPVVQAIILYMALIVVIINFVVDILYKMVDPRLN